MIIVDIDLGVKQLPNQINVIISDLFFLAFRRTSSKALNQSIFLKAPFSLVYPTPPGEGKPIYNEKLCTLPLES